MKILVTGSAGFIGFHLCLELLSKNHIVFGLDNLNKYYSRNYKLYRTNLLNKYKNFKFIKQDLRNINELKRKLDKIDVKAVYHLASQPGIMYSFKNPNQYLSNNILATKNLIQIYKSTNIEKFYFSSSSSVYGNKRKFPIKENYKLNPLNYYAETKKKCENLLIKGFKGNKIDLKIFRPFTVYGPFGRPDMLFLSYFNSIKRNSVFNLYNYGNYVRDFTYVKDVANILTLFLNVPKSKDKVFNICSSKPIRIKKFIHLINENYKRKVKLNYLPTRKGEMLRTYGSNYKLKKKIKFNKFTSIKQGIKNTLKWYLKFKNKNNLNI